jgi:tetratricopeptide (TPR) repeat protein
MAELPNREEKDELDELLSQYEELRGGGVQSFLEEEAFERIIEHFQQKEMPEKALEASLIAVERYPYSSSLLIRKADVLVLHRRYKEALRVLDQAEILDSRDINIYILRTDAYLALDQPEKAVSLLERSLGKFEGEEKVELLFELADVYDDYEDFEKVFDCLKEVLKEDPLNEEALYKICFWTDFTGRNEEGIRLYQEILDEHPFSELAWFNLGAAYQGLRLYEKAIDAYKYAVAIEEKFDYAYRNMGDAFIRLHRYRDAIEVLERVHELAKPEDVIFEAIGYCYEKLKQPAIARLQYRKASHLRKDDSRLIYKIACTYFSEGQWSAAYKQIEVALRIIRGEFDYQLLAGQCCEQLERIQEAVEHYVMAVQLKPKKIAGWNALIRCLFEAEAWEDALKQIDLALHATKGKILFLYYRAAVLFGAARNQEALKQLEEALMKDPKQVKKFVSLIPSVMQQVQVVDLLARYKRKKGE